MKTGRFSKDEIKYIEDNAKYKTYDQIAADLGRDPNTVKKTAVKHGFDETMETRMLNAEHDIKKSPYWKELQSQFDEEELESFVFHWAKIVAQFRDDVLHTEEIQILDFVKVEILMNRVLKNQQSLKSTIKDLESMLKEEKEKEGDARDFNTIQSLQAQLSAAYASYGEFDKQFNSLIKEKKVMYREMKASREQRIKRLESSQENFTQWVAEVLTNPSMRRELGRKMEKMRLATDVEIERLAEWHEYGDGQVDQPILSPETLRNE